MYIYIYIYTYIWVNPPPRVFAAQECRHNCVENDTPRAIALLYEVSIRISVTHSHWRAELDVIGFAPANRSRRATD